MKLTIICFPPLLSIVLIHRLTASSKNWHHVIIHYIEEQFNHTPSHWNHHQGKREPHVIQQRLFVHKVRYQDIKGIVEWKHLARLMGIHSSLWQLMSTPRQELLLPQSLHIANIPIKVFQWKHTFLKTLIKPPSQCFSKPSNRTGWKTYRDRELRSKALLTSATSALSFPSRL